MEFSHNLLIRDDEISGLAHTLFDLPVLPFPDEEFTDLGLHRLSAYKMHHLPLKTLGGEFRAIHANGTQAACTSLGEFGSDPNDLLVQFNLALLKVGLRSQQAAQAGKKSPGQEFGTHQHDEKQAYTVIQSGGKGRRA